MAINGRAKGANGEREAADWLFKYLPLFRLPERNLEQVRHGGSDLLHTSPLCVEVKRCKDLSLNAWWRQVMSACDENEIPVVMFRQNNKQWEFLIPATYIGVKTGFIRIDRFIFITWATPQFVV